MDIIIGILIWQTVTFLVCLITSRKSTNRSITAMCGMGTWSLILIGLNRLVEGVAQVIRNARYKALMVDTNGQLCYCESNQADHYLDKGYNFATKLRNKYTPQDGWRKDDCPIGMISLRYVPIQIIKKENAYQLK